MSTPPWQPSGERSPDNQSPPRKRRAGGQARRSILVVAAIAVVIILVGVAALFYTNTRPATDTAWTGFPRSHACAPMPRFEDPFSDSPTYIARPPALSVLPKKVYIENLGDSIVHIEVTFAGTPEPVQQVLLPGYGNQRYPEPGSWGFAIQLVPQGNSAQDMTPIDFADSNDDGYGWNGWQFEDGFKSEQRILPVNDWRFQGNTFSLTADLSDYFNVPKGDEFFTDFQIRTWRNNYPPTGYEPTNDAWEPWAQYPTYDCPQLSSQSHQASQRTTTTSQSALETPEGTTTTTASPPIYAGLPCDSPGATSPDGRFGCSGENRIWLELNAAPLPTIRGDSIGQPCTSPGAKARLEGSDGVLTCTSTGDSAYIWVRGPD